MIYLLMEFDYWITLAERVASSLTRAADQQAMG